MSNDYVLSPFCFIKKQNDGFLIGTLFDVEKSIHIKSISEINPNITEINNSIFIKKEDLSYYKKSCFDRLEMSYFSQKVQLGYIDTTTVCPYKCRMCPKYKFTLDRSQKELDLESFENIIMQLKHQAGIELHLFGDPFYDDNIYKKIYSANKNGIFPSFSTNLVSLNKVNMQNLINLKIDHLTISLDAISVPIFNKTRGHITKSEIDNCLELLKNILSKNSSSNFIKQVVLQSICLTTNKNERIKVKDLANYFQCAYYEKNYISFPSNDNDIGEVPLFHSDEKLFLYDLIGAQTPFRCLKAWNRKEMAIMSDGALVPCCLMYNDTAKIGNIKKCTLKDLQEGEKAKTFRKQIWNSYYCGEICKLCTQNKVKYSHSAISNELISSLKKYCISSW